MGEWANGRMGECGVARRRGGERGGELEGEGDEREREVYEEREVWIVHAKRVDDDDEPFVVDGSSPLAVGGGRGKR